MDKLTFKQNQLSEYNKDKVMTSDTCKFNNKKAEGLVVFYSDCKEGWNSIQINQNGPINGTNAIKIHCH